MRTSMAENGYSGPPIDVVKTPSGIATVDHTRAAVALEQGITSIPATLHLPTDLCRQKWRGDLEVLRRGVKRLRTEQQIKDRHFQPMERHQNYPHKKVGVMSMGTDLTMPVGLPVAY